MSNTNNPFDLFKPTETSHKIAALNGAEVTLKTLSQAEKAEIDAVLYSGGFEDGKPVLSMEALNKANIVKLSKILVEPKMSIKDLERLSVEVDSAFKEIIDLVTPKVEEGK